MPDLMENISFTEDEEAEILIPIGEFQDVVSNGKTCIVAKLVADLMVSKETIRTTLKRWWKLYGNMSFKVLGDNLFLIEFTNIRDKERVLDGRPWVFEGNLFLVEDFDGTIPPSKYTFEKAAFWVRMIDLPLGCMGQAIGRRIGETVGAVEMVDTDANGIGWGEFLRVKILLDLSKPLPRGRKINIQGKCVWITFQYEHLPKLCFTCGIIVMARRGVRRIALCETKKSLNTVCGYEQLPLHEGWKKIMADLRKVLQRSHDGRGVVNRPMRT